MEAEATYSMESSKSACASTDFVEKSTPNGRCIVQVQVLKMPSMLTKVLDDSADIFQTILEGKSEHKKTVALSLKEKIQADQSLGEESEVTEDLVLMLRKRMIDAVETETDNGSELEEKRSEEDRKPWLSLLQRIWALGPRHIGPNILLYPKLPTRGGDIKGLGGVSDGDTSNAEPVLVCGSPHISENLGLFEILAE